MAGDVSQYKSAKPFLGGFASWIADKEEQLRIAAYDWYEDVYWNNPDAFKLVSRGQEDKPIYIPAGRTIVETMHRYVLPKFQVICDPLSTANMEEAKLFMDAFLRREKFNTQLAQNKRYGLIRGDAMFLVYADPLKPEGSRVSLRALDPGQVFKLTLADDVNAVIGYDIVDQVDYKGKPAIRRQTYMKTTGLPGPSPILYTDEIYEADKWGGPGMVREEAKLLKVHAPPLTLPQPIDELPIYHTPNTDDPRRLWGSSELRGFERLIAAISQSVSDEELALALDGLGVYVTDAGTPVNAEGEDVGWDMGPGRVVELPTSKTMKRLTGVSSVTPYQEHLKYLHGQIDEATAMSSVAKGRIDVQTAESGVALALELAPLLSRAGEKDAIWMDGSNSMFWNLNKWFAAYEGGVTDSWTEGGIVWTTTVGDPLPKNVDKEVDRILSLVEAKVISPSYARSKLRELGYDDMPDDLAMNAEILQFATANAQATQDAFGARVDGEVQAELGNGVV